MSSVELPRKIQVSPPDMNTLTNPTANSMAGVNRIFPRNNVVIQLKTFTEEGTAMSKVNKTNTEPRNGFMPLTNIWCAHTKNESVVMENNEPTMAV